MTRISGTGTCNESLGFTLIELSVVILILSIVLGVSLNLFHSGLIGNDFKSSLRDLQALFSQMRYEAVLQKAPLELIIDLDHPRAATYWLSTESEESKKPLLRGDLSLVGLQKGKNDPQTAGRAKIRFLPQGLAEPTMLFFNDQGEKRVVVLQAVSPRLQIRNEPGMWQ